MGGGYWAGMGGRGVTENIINLFINNRTAYQVNIIFLTILLINPKMIISFWLIFSFLESFVLLQTEVCLFLDLLKHVSYKK